MNQFLQFIKLVQVPIINTKLDITATLYYTTIVKPFLRIIIIYINT